MKGLAVHENRNLQIVELPMPEYNELNFPSLKTAAKAAYSSQTTIYL